jgi:hypothetical protein
LKILQLDVACAGGKRNVYEVVVGKLEESRSLGGTQRRQEGNIGVILKGMRLVVVDWMYLAEGETRSGLFWNLWFHKI